MHDIRYFISHETCINLKVAPIPWAQPAITCSKLTTETLEQGVKYAQG